MLDPLYMYQGAVPSDGDEARRRAMTYPPPQLPDAGMYGPPSQGNPPQAAMNIPSGYMPQDPQAGLRQALAQGLGGMPGPPIPEDYQKRVDAVRSTIAPGPAEERYLAAQMAQPEAVHGLRARLAAIGKGLLLGTANGGLLGAPFGAIMGAANPSGVNFAASRFQLPMLGAAAQAEEQSRNSQLRRAQEVAGMAGYDPITGLRTPQAGYHDYMNALALGRLGQGDRRLDIQEQNSASLGAVRQARMEQIRQKYAQVPFENFIKAYNSGTLNGDHDALVAMAEKAGIPNPDQIEPKFLQGMIKTVVDQNFGVNTLNLRTGEVASTGITSSQKTLEEGRQAGRTEAKRHNLATEAASQARLTDTEEREIDKQARATHKLSRFATQDKDAVAANEAAVATEKQRLRTEYMARKDGNQAVSQQQFPPLTKGTLKQGGQFTYQGKKVKITHVNADGSFGYEVLP